MKLYEILQRHCAPKDCVENTIGYVIADNDMQVLKYIDKELNYDGWYDRQELDDGYIDKMLSMRGEFNDDDADYSDAFYGVTHYGWLEGSKIEVIDAGILINLKIAKDLMIKVGL